jgi:hypothetical protein
MVPVRLTVSKASKKAKPKVQQGRGLRRLGVFDVAVLRKFREVGFGCGVLEARDENS